MTRRRNPRRWLLLLSLALLLGNRALPTPVVAAGTQHVTDCGDAGPNTLRGKISSAAAGDTIVFDQNCIITLTTGSLQITKDVTIDGTGHTVTVDGGCVLSGASCVSGGDRVFVVSNTATASLNHLTIQHGNSPSVPAIGGGGIWNAGGTLSVTNSTIANNSGHTGGGILSGGGPLTVTNSTFSGNGGGEGGGIYGVGIVTVTNSTFSGNYATGGEGGGIKIAGGTLAVTDSTFSTNTLAYLGGGIESGSGATLTMTHCTLSGNQAALGGGIDVAGIATVMNSSLSGNTADSRGGGIFNAFSGTLKVTNSTLSGNHATSSPGGGIFNNGALTVTNSTLSTNTSGAEGGGIYNGSIVPDTIPGMAVTNSTFSANTTTSYGGGVSNHGLMSVTNSTFTGNSTSANAGFGGGIYNTYDSAGNVTVTNCTISGTTAPPASTAAAGASSPCTARCA